MLVSLAGLESESVGVRTTFFFLPMTRQNYDGQFFKGFNLFYFGTEFGWQLLMNKHIVKHVAFLPEPRVKPDGFRRESS